MIAEHGESIPDWKFALQNGLILDIGPSAGHFPPVVILLLSKLVSKRKAMSWLCLASEMTS